MKRRTCLLGACGLVLLVGTAVCGAQTYEAKWESLDGRPTPQWWTDAKFGIFIHWGLYSVPAWSVRGEYSEWYWNRITGDKAKNGPWWRYHSATYGADFPYAAFAPMFKAELFDPNHWAEVFQRSGAKYVVLTSKHHDGFCLWPSEQANRSWGRPWNSVDIGPRRDLLGDLGDAVRAKGLKMGFYYSLYEWYNPLWLADRTLFVEKHMIPQFKDVVTRYKPSVIFSDGEWDMPDKNWRSEELLAWLYNESPCRDDVVVNDRWGKDIRHKHGGYYTTEYGAGLADASHPWEENRGMAHSFGYSRTETLSDYKTSRELILMLIDLVSRGGNLLLDIGPDGDGTIPVIMEERLVQIGDWLRVNGEAIYGTRPWRNAIQWTEGKRPDVAYGAEYKAKYDITELTGPPAGDKAVIAAFFTAKGGTLYAICPRWPQKEMVLKDIDVSPDATVTMLGLAQPLSWRRSGRDVVVQVPTLSVDETPCEHAYVLRLTQVR
ncbi:MAG: alpha-L-fucosidase [Sedimentisphaerales bacterium]|nr:alpha-L-fucosidase [Sedimentisphaerales bacterium]HNY77063.1 alpha-L-fucosidase [Sedimentisphaerales bacterium]HOC62522.1 alpha-L-fucosidase [Sedimentisphaerales bacterium]HOH63040.1 alpha-L-fucosidase [Sedimentisphaerales bacterium]HPY49613.1 alpha-L-fucosidase [Sedimentisphaerales bacterium]